MLLTFSETWGITFLNNPRYSDIQSGAEIRRRIGTWDD